MKKRSGVMKIAHRAHCRMTMRHHAARSALAATHRARRNILGILIASYRRGARAYQLAAIRLLYLRCYTACDAVLPDSTGIQRPSLPHIGILP